MTSIEDLCRSLIQCESQESVIELLDSNGFWGDDSMWRYYGDNESNWSIVGNQQAKADAALMEKFVNSADAVLMGEALARGVDPEGPEAPASIRDAVHQFFDEGAGESRGGDIGRMSTKQRTELAKNISVYTSGQQGAAPNFNIADLGEGQKPMVVPETILSLMKGNKLRVPFVQGKFNQGGTGVLRFCDMQIVVTKRRPDLEDLSEMEARWSFTVVRKEAPSGNRRNSCFTYLAPVESRENPRRGDLLTFSADSLPLFPRSNVPYAEDAGHGTLIKLLGYQAKGFSGQMLLRDGLKSRTDILLPSIALPIRMNECRTGYKGKTGSFATTTSGLSVRLEDDARGNIEEGFPTSSPVIISGEEVTVSVFAFKADKASGYRKASEGIVFTVNGQTHGLIPTRFFRSQRVLMGRIADSLLVLVDCSTLSPAAIEELFMTSRDRLGDGPLRSAIESQLEDLIHNHAGLRKLKEERDRRDLETKLGDSKPLADILSEVLKTSPSLSALFLSGTRLPDPFKKKGAGQQEDYEGQSHPSYFRARGKEQGDQLIRSTPINERSRIKFETDVVNDYFDRSIDPGEFVLWHIQDGIDKHLSLGTHRLDLFDGVATLTVDLDEKVAEGEILQLRADVLDPVLDHTFSTPITLNVLPARLRDPAPGKNRRPPRSNTDGDDREQPGSVALPKIIEISEEQWANQNPAFTADTAMRLDRAEVSEGGRNLIENRFRVNVDNRYLRTEQKRSGSSDSKILRAKFVTFLSLLGLSLIHQAQRKVPNGEDEFSIDPDTLEPAVEQISAAVAPIALPMLDELGSLNPD